MLVRYVSSFGLNLLHLRQMSQVTWSFLSFARLQTKLQKCDHSIFYIVYSTHVKALAPFVFK